ncbi:MAG TPA: tape measure protein [Syntrophomonas sp.]|nr:tape measure protein [Syntrophomonas sp.]
MATIRTAIQLYDGMSPALRNINRAINIVIASLESMEKVSQRSIDTRSIQAARVELNKTGLAFSAIKREIQEADQAQQSFNRDTRAGKNKNDGESKGGIKWDSLKGVAEKASKVLQLSDEMALMPARLNLMNDGFQTTAQLQDMIFQSAQRSRSGYLDTAKVVTKLGVAAKDAFSNNRETVAFAELMNKSFKIGPGSAQEQTDGMEQLIQAMGAGGLQGDEIKNIQGNAPILAQSIENYMQAAGVEGTLEEWAAQGLITADVIKNAMFAAADETNARFDQLPMTWSDIWTTMVNSVLRISQPLLNFINLLANNWDILRPIVLGTVFAILLYLAVTKGVAFVSAAFTAIQTFLSIGFGILTGSTAAASAAMFTYNSALLASPITWIIFLVIALIAVFYAAVAAVNKFAGTSYSATGFICGAFLVAAAVIGNIIIGLLNALIQFVWALFAEPFLGIIEWILNVTNGGFESFGGAVANLIGQIISWFLSLGKVVTKIIDAIFGTNWTAGLSSLQDSVLAWGKTKNSITLDRSVPTIDHRFSYGSAWDKGLSFGSNVEDKLKGVMDNLSNIYDGVTDTAANTGRTADSLDISEEDLKYMRDLAEREVIDRTVLRDVNFELSNSFGDIRETADVDGIITTIENRLAEAIANEAEGSYSV